MKDFSSTVHSTKQPNRAHRVVTFFFRKMPLLWIERNGKFLSIKKANTKGEENRAQSNVLGLATNSTQSIKSKLQLLCYSAHGSNDTTHYRNNSTPRSSQLTCYHDDAYRGWMWPNKISSAIQHIQSDISCGTCSHTQKAISDNTHHMINRQDATISNII